MVLCGRKEVSQVILLNVNRNLGETEEEGEEGERGERDQYYFSLQTVNSPPMGVASVTGDRCGGWRCSPWLCS